MNSLTSFTEDMAQRGMTAGSRIVSFRQTVPDPTICKALGLSVGEKVFECVRLRLADDEPMALEVSTLVNSMILHLNNKIK